MAREAEVEYLSEEEILVASALVKGDQLEISEETYPDCFQRWKFGLVGRFIKGRLPIATIRTALSFYWGRLRSFDILQANENAWLILFDSEENMMWALHNGPWAVCGRILFLEKWTANFNFDSEVQTRVPVWLHLPDLPKSLLSRKAIIALASMAGEPIGLDPASLRIESSKTARVKIWCDLASPLLQGSRIVINGFTVWQRFQFGGFIRPCNNCGIIGHAPSICPDIVPERPRGRSSIRRRRRSVSKPVKIARRNGVDIGTGARDKQGVETEPAADGMGGGDTSPVGMVGDMDSGLKADDSGLKVGDSDSGEDELIVQLTGEGEAELTVQEGMIGAGFNTEIPTSSGGGAGPSKGKTTARDMMESDLEGEVPETQFSLPGAGRGPGAQEVGKSREGKATLYSARGSRRIKEQTEGTSVADRLRAAGANEGVKVKANKPHKATKVVFES